VVRGEKFKFRWQRLRILTYLLTAFDFDFDFEISISISIRFPSCKMDSTVAQMSERAEEITVMPIDLDQKLSALKTLILDQMSTLEDIV
jgi:hypothetical protein